MQNNTKKAVPGRERLFASFRGVVFSGFHFFGNVQGTQDAVVIVAGVGDLGQEHQVDLGIFKGHQIGILVDEVREVVTLEEEDIEKVVHDEQGMNLLGVGKYKETLISLLNIQGIIQELDNA